MNPQIQALQAQLAAYQNPAQAPIPQSVPMIQSTPVVPATQVTSMNEVKMESQEDIKQMIKEAVAAQLKELGGSSKPRKKYTFIESIEEALSTRDQNWLADMTIINELPYFIVSDKGRQLTQAFVKEYRDYYENQT